MGKHHPIQLTAEERTTLSEVKSHGVHTARVPTRAAILLLLDRSQGQARTLADVAEASLVSSGTVSNVKKHYLERRSKNVEV